MIKVKSFTTQLKIFHARHELDALDKEVSDFIASRGIRKVISIGDSSTTGNTGETIGLIRVLAYEEPVAGSKEHYQEQIESTLNGWGEEIEKIRKKADKLGAEARGKYQEQIEELRARQETARKKLEDLKRAGGEAWEDLRSGDGSGPRRTEKGRGRSRRQTQKRMSRTEVRRRSHAAAPYLSFSQTALLCLFISAPDNFSQNRRFRPVTRN